MFPDTVPSPKAAEPLEAQLRQFELGEPPETLAIRMTEFTDAQPLEALLLAFELQETSAALDARMATLLTSAGAQNDALAHRPGRAFWRRASAFATAFGALAAGFALAFLLLPQIQQTHTAPPQRTSPRLAQSPAPTANLPGQVAVSPAPPTTLPTQEAGTPNTGQVFEGAVPVGYQYQGSHVLYARETPVGTVIGKSGQPQRAMRCDSLERHMFRNPETQATYEVDEPHANVVLKDLQSY